MDKPESQETNLKEQEIANELDLKKAEYALKVQEFKAKSKIDERNLWFTSPILVAVLSALFGLLGTGIGAALQGYSNTQLERQKFEATLIQKALESTQPEERARNLLFLVDAGLIKSLDSGKIEELARNPAKLPVVIGSASATNKCKCPPPASGEIMCPENFVAICKEEGGQCSGKCVRADETIKPSP